MMKVFVMLALLIIVFTSCEKRRLNNDLCKCVESPVNPELVGLNNLLEEQMNDSQNIIYEYSATCSDNNIEVTFEISPPACYGGNDGWIIFHITGGSSPYQISNEINENASNNIYFGLEAGLYNFTITDNTNCQLFISNVEIPNSNNYCISIPNVFTPNEDGINDKWEISNLNSYPNFEISIYNKRGRVMKTIKNGDSYWDGTINDKLISDGAYKYKIIIGEIIHEGFVCIITERLPKGEYECNMYLTPAVYDDPYLTYW
jgi:gliding motility-associated-like protein